MKHNLSVAAALAVAALLPACGGSSHFAPSTTPLAAQTMAVHKAVPTPYPLPSKTPDWQTVEKPVPWDFTSTGPDTSKCGPHDGLIYRVGPGQMYPQPHNVPWLRLLPCDTVMIYPGTTPYSDVVNISVSGALHRSITIEGVLDPKTGARPVFDGSHAQTSPNEATNPYLVCAGMIIVGIPDDTIPYRYGYKPSYIIVKNLEVRNAFGKYPNSNQPSYTCTDTKGVPHPWAEFSSGLYFNPGQHILIQNNYLHNNGLGAFVNSLNGPYQQSRDFIVKDNTMENNGNGEASLHNMYFEVVGERVIHNHFGPPIVNTQGENIKDRGVCIEYSDNYIDSGNNLIAFRDPQSNGTYEAKEVDAFGNKCNGEIYVHGNTFVSRGPTVWQAMSVINGFGDGTVEGDPWTNRFGAVYFYSNVVIAIADRDNYGLSAAPIFQNGNLKNGPTTWYGINDLFYSAPATAGHQAPKFAACYWQQYVSFTSDWVNLPMEIKYSKATDGNDSVGTPCDGSGMGGLTVSKADPGFVNFAGGDFHTTPSSPFNSLKAPLPQAVVTRKLLPDGVPYP